MGKYDKMTQEDFNRILGDIMQEAGGRAILTIPGVYEVVSEHFNNDVLDRWEQEQGGMGSLWWILKPEELVAFRDSIEMGRPIEILKIDYTNHTDGQADVIFRLEKSKAKEILGYEPDEGDWMEEDE